MKFPHHILPLPEHSILQLYNKQSKKSDERSQQRDFFSVIINQLYDEGKWKGKLHIKVSICMLCEFISCIYIVILSCTVVMRQNTYLAFSVFIYKLTTLLESNRVSLLL
jgi:hypothetical protein